MARKNPETPVSFDKDKKARQANAEKQKRYRESMKAQGYRARLIWEKPLDTGLVRVPAPVLHKASVEIIKKNPVIREALEGVCGSFIMECEKKKISKDKWNPVYRDIQVLLEPLFGKKWVT